MIMKEGIMKMKNINNKKNNGKLILNYYFQLILLLNYGQ